MNQKALIPWLVVIAVIAVGAWLIVFFLNPNTGTPHGTNIGTATGTIPSETPSSANTHSGPAFDIAKRPAGPPTASESAYMAWMLANTPEDRSYLAAKWQDAQTLLAEGDITDPRVLQAFLLTPRENFFHAGSPAVAYALAPQPIGYGQTISNPRTVALMTQAIDPQPDQSVLEVGTGSGYQSAILAELSSHVYTMEIVPQLATAANARYDSLAKQYPEYGNITRTNADGYYGWPAHAPFDRIIVTAGIDHVPPALLQELAPGGIMVIPVGPPSGQVLLRIVKNVTANGTTTYVRSEINNGQTFIFVPFTGGGNASQ